MDASSSKRRPTRAGVLAASAAALLAWAAACGAAAAADAPAALSADDSACVGCHGAEGISKDLANGDKISLTVNADAFAHSVHRGVGCAGCHPKIALTNHPGDVKTAKSAHDYTLAQVEACRACHDKTFKTYESSLHAVKLAEGNSAAPTCVGCHAPHAVSRASATDGPDRACMTCHGDPASQHASWLPNAAKHLDAIACSAGHAPDALRQVDLRLYANGKPITELDGAAFEKLARNADRNKDGLDANEFRSLIADLERGGAKVSVVGHMQLRDAAQAHELAAKPTTLKACVDCHTEDASPFEKVTVSVLDADGRAVRYDAHKDVLRSAMSAESLRSFYAVGGTRIKLLDVLLVLGLVGGISVPALHLAIRRAMRSKNEGSKS